MAISFKCGGCAKQYLVKDELAGKKAQCKQCGQVMTIPMLAASAEPDLMAEGREPSGQTANAETVAGSLITSPIETVAGRTSSMSGRSVSGQSAAGRSASGASSAGRRAPQQPAYEPPADPEFDAPPLSAMMQVQQSAHEAFDVAGGTDQPLRQGRGPALKNRAPMEAVSLLLAGVMVAALAYSAYVAMNAVPANASPAALAEAGKPTMAAIASRGTLLLAAIAVVTPLVMAAWVAGCKIANYRTPDNLFMRSLGLASLPVAAWAVALAVPALKGSEALLCLACIPAAYAVLHFVHNQKPILAGATVGIATLTSAAGMAIASTASDKVQTAMMQSYNQKLAQIASAEKNKAKIDVTPTGPVTPAAPTADTLAADAAVKTAADKVDELKKSLANTKQTREPLLLAADAATALVDAGKAKFADRPEWATLAADLTSARSTIAKFPTAEPPADLAEAPPAGQDWTTHPGRREVSAFGFDLTPPLEGKFDLDSTDDAGGKMVWSVGDSRTTLTIEQATAASDKQQKPWVVPAYVAESAKNAAVTVVADGQPDVEYGTINGLPAAKVSVSDNGTPSVVYTVHNGADWLRCTISPATAGDTSFAAAQQSVRSLRPRAAGEPKLDAISPAELVARFENDPSSIDRVVALLKPKPNAEDTVVKAMGFAPNDATLRKYGPLLIATGTERSSAALWKLAGLGTSLGDEARVKLAALEPKTADDFAFALLDIKSGSTSQMKKGLSIVALSDLDKTRAPAVSKVVQAGIDDQSLLSGANAQSAEAVMTKYFDDEIGKRLQAIVDTEHSATTARKTAMRVLGASGKKKYVLSISKWAMIDPNSVIETLVAMGPVAEPEVDTYLNSRPDGRKTWLSILEQIGTQRSLSALQTCATKSGDAEVREQAKALILKIKSSAAK